MDQRVPADDARGSEPPGSGGPDLTVEPEITVEAEITAEVERRTKSSPTEPTPASCSRELVGCGRGRPARQRIRDQLVEMHLPLVEYLARRFRNRGEPLDDLVQVATIGLIKSIDRFDLDRGVEFSTYATPTIVGEIKRHFRDKGWAIRVPRRLQELKLALNKATSELSQRNGRAPTVAELAGHLELQRGRRPRRARVGERLLRDLTGRAGHRRRRLPRGGRLARRDRRGARGRRVPRVAQAAARAAAAAGEEDPAAALLRAT